MTHLPQLIVDLGLILVVAGGTTLIFKKIRQPVVLGYILAGFLVGPYTSLMPTVADEEGIRTWSEIGVIFLLFSLGLEFSFKKLVKVGGAASITAFTEIIIMIAVGYFTGQFMGWSSMDSLFLGAILSMSSTTIIIRAFEEAGARTKKFASLVFGILIVEDLVAILLMVLLSTVAVSKQFAGGELIIQLLKLLFFLTVWFLGGIFLIPTFLKKTRKLMNDETMLVVSLGLCLGMVILAVQAGFSAALGAFIMGSILAETTQAERIEHLIMPVKDFFAAIFFVSVGMMINPQVLVDYAIPVIIITLITIFGKLISTALGALISGQSLKHSLQAGMSLAQIGEFSFIIASLGVSLNVTSAFLYPIAVAASAVTTLTTPFMIKHSEPVYLFLERVMPARWTSVINRYSSGTQKLTATSDWNILIRAYLVNSIVYGALSVAIILLVRNYLYPVIDSLIMKKILVDILTFIITILLLAPIIWALSFRRISKDAYSRLWLNSMVNRGSLTAIEFLRIAISILLVGILVEQYLPTIYALLVILVILTIAFILFSSKLHSFYDRLESRFMRNLNEREIRSAEKSSIAPWDSHLTEFDVSPESLFIGKPLQELAFRERFGINIALIERGTRTIITPDKSEMIYPGDKISVIGTDSQINNFKNYLDRNSKDIIVSDSLRPDIGLQNFLIDKSSPLYNVSIRQSGMREKMKVLVVGLERDGVRIVNPDSNTVIQKGDMVWVVGERSQVSNYFKHIKQSGE